MAEENGAVRKNSSTSASSSTKSAGYSVASLLSHDKAKSNKKNHHHRHHSSEAVAGTDKKVQAISKNCKRFNHIFHCSGSEDSTSSSDTLIETSKATSSSVITKEFTTISSISKHCPSSNSTTIVTTLNSSTRGISSFKEYSSTEKYKDRNESTTTTSTCSAAESISIVNKVSLDNVIHATPKTSEKKITDHGISKLLLVTDAKLEPVLHQRVSTNRNMVPGSGVKKSLHEENPSSTLEIKDLVNSKISNNNPASDDPIVNDKNSHEKPSSPCNSYDLELEIEGQVEETETLEEDTNSCTSTGTSLEKDPASLMNMEMDEEIEGSIEDNEGVDDLSEDELELEKAKEKKKLAQRLKKESKKLILQLTDSEKRKSNRLVSKTTFCKKKHDAQVMKRLKQIVKKPLDEMTPDERQLQDSFPHLVNILKKRHETRILASERLKEIEDSPEDLEIKCHKLAKVIKKAKYLVVYTGAGISTSASIPDYRGPNGIWTLLRNGQTLDAQSPAVLTTADPTLTHMAIKALHSEHIIKHIVSQNCDGLHLRSGIPKTALSEVHGNMYIEVCIKCSREYVRSFDVTENTRRYEHRTGRHCYRCGCHLKDTVVHFGERGSLRWPLNWAGAEYNVARADVILCMGSSLKVLRRYPWLWGMDLPVNKRPKLFIVNLQWTPKDNFAALKIHGKCDEVMTKVMSKLKIPIPSYKREQDQIFRLATPLHESELDSKSAQELSFPSDKLWPRCPQDINNYIRFEAKFSVQIPADLKIKIEKEEEDKEEDLCDETNVRSPTANDEIKMESDDDSTNDKKDIIMQYKKKERKKRDRNIIIKGNGNGWFGNAWGKCIKPKKRKTSVSKT